MTGTSGAAGALWLLTLSLVCLWAAPWVRAWEVRRRRAPFVRPPMPAPPDGPTPPEGPAPPVARLASACRLWGWPIPARAVTAGWGALTAACALLPLLLADPVWMAAGLAGLGACAPLFLLRLLETRYVWRVERGLREAALPLGLSALEATEDVGLALDEILAHGRDPVIRRTFQAIQARRVALGLPADEALAQHALSSDVPVAPALVWLAQYTQTLRRYGARPSTIWREVLADLRDQAQVRSMLRAKTAYFRYGAYLFGAGGLTGLLVGYPAYAASLVGWTPWALLLWALLVGWGVYRMARVG